MSSQFFFSFFSFLEGGSVFDMSVVQLVVTETTFSDYKLLGLAEKDKLS